MLWLGSLFELRTRITFSRTICDADPTPLPDGVRFPSGNLHFEQSKLPSRFVETGAPAESLRDNGLDRDKRRVLSYVGNSPSGRWAMKFHELETVVLERDIPERGLRRGDLGAVVELYESDGLDVEFVRASGKT
jgi:hypothetical protein